LHRMGLLGDGRMEVMRQRYGSSDYRAAEGVVRGVLVRSLAEHYGDDMARIECPVVLVWGEHDDEVPVDVARRSVPLFRSATLQVIAGRGHLIPLEAPDELRAAVLGPRPCGGGQ